MKFCFFNSNKAWGGGEKWHLETAKFLLSSHDEVLIVTNHQSKLKEKAQENNLPWESFQVGNLSFLNPFKIISVRNLLKREKIEVIFLNLPQDLKLAGLAAKLAGVKKIIYRRGMPHPLRNTFLNRFYFKHILTHVVANSEEIARSLKKGNESWFPKEKLHLLYNGVKPHHETPSPLFTKTEKVWYLGNAGRLTSQKGQEYLIQMAKMLKEKNFPFHLFIAGEGELQEKLQAMIHEFKLEKEVTLLGHVQEMERFFSALDFFIFPSAYEGSANTLIETLMAKLPSIAFNVSSMPEIIQHERTGLLAPLGDAQALAQAVIRLSEDQELREKIKSEGFKLVQEKFDQEKNLREFFLTLR